jgi:hypothetical protein
MVQQIPSILRLTWYTSYKSTDLLSYMPQVHHGDLRKTELYHNEFSVYVIFRSNFPKLCLHKMYHSK